ncbi:MAG: lipopolysaccharide biosynthesis protein [Isosphaeraceae bacterium]
MSPRNRLGHREIPLNALASWSTYAAQIGAAFLVTPIVVRGLGDQRYGVWSLVESVLAYLTLLDFGLTASVVRYVARFEATAESDRRNRVFSTCLCLFGAIGAVAFAISVGLAVGLPYLFRLPPELIGEARWMFLLLGTNLALGLPLSVYLNVLFGLGRYPTSAAIRVLYLALGSILSVVIVRRGGGLIALGCLITAVNTAQNLTLAWAVHRCLPDLRLSPSLVDWSTFRDIRGYSLRVFLIGLGSQVSFQTDAIVIGAFLNPGAIAFFAIGSRLVSYSKTLFTPIMGVLTPTFSAMEARGETEAIRGLTLTVSRYVLWGALPVQIGLIALGRPFLSLWIGPRYAEASYATLVILSIPLALAMTLATGVRVLYGTGRLEWYTRAVIAEAAANLILSTALASPVGIEGVAWGTTIPNLVFNLALMIHTCRVLEIGLWEYSRGVFLRPILLGATLACGWGAVLSIEAEPSTWLSLLATGGVGLLAYGFIALIVEFGPRWMTWVIRSRIRALTGETHCGRSGWGGPSM